MSPARPNENDFSAGPPLLLLRIYHRPSRNTPGVRSPSPSQSQKIGLPVALPNLKLVTVRSPEPTPPRRYHVPPRKTAGRSARTPTRTAGPDHETGPNPQFGWSGAKSMARPV